MEKTTVYLPPALQRELRELAQRRELPQAELIREALALYLSSQAKPRPRSVGLGEDSDLAAANSEDYLRRRWGRE